MLTSKAAGDDRKTLGELEEDANDLFGTNCVLVLRIGSCGTPGSLLRWPFGMFLVGLKDLTWGAWPMYTRAAYSRGGAANGHVRTPLEIY